MSDSSNLQVNRFDMREIKYEYEYARVNIEDSSRNRFAINSIQRDFFGGIFSGGILSGYAVNDDRMPLVRRWHALQVGIRKQTNLYISVKENNKWMQIKTVGVIVCKLCDMIDDLGLKSINTYDK